MCSRPALTRRDLVRASCLLSGGAALGALAAPWFSSSGSVALARQDPAVPTKTREAELDELHALQTEVARPNVCTPASTETPVPATATATVVPSLATGEAIPYGDQFVVTVLGIAPVPAGGDVQPQGRLLKVNVTLFNRTLDTLDPPFTDWLLTDASGQSYSLNRDASDEIAGIGWGLPIPGGTTEDRAIIFDVLPDSGTSFILESRDVPTFRIALAIEARG